MENQNMGDIMQTQRDFSTNDLNNMPVAPAVVPQVPYADQNILQGATGIPLSTVATSDQTTTHISFRPPTKEENESAQLINVQDELIQDRHDKITGALEGKDNDLNDLISGALSEETDRANRLTEALNDPEEVKKLKNPEEVTYESVPRSNTKPNTLLYDMDALVPSYSTDDMNASSAADDQSPAPSVDDSDSADNENSPKYMKSLEHAESDVDFTIAKKIREKKIVAVSSNRYKESKAIGDQAFLNSVTAFKRDNYGVVSIPLVNSGFTVNMVGTGVVDLKQLYTGVTEDMTVMDYNIEQMRVMIRNVVGTNPKIDPNNLRNMIHFQDFQLMAFAHVCATLDKTQMVTNCFDCGKPFRIEATPTSMILNMNEMKDRMDNILSGASIETTSLLTSNRKFITDDNFEITIGHPSYADIIKLYADVKEYSSHMSPVESKIFTDGFEDFTMIREIKMPNGVKTSNVYQVHTAMKLLRSEDQIILQKMIGELRDQIIVPKFGIQKVTCPHCGKVNTNIEYNSLAELVFYHTQISDLLNAPEA